MACFLLNRRTLVAGLPATLLLSARAGAEDRAADQALRAVLDGAQSDPDGALAGLAATDPTRLSLTAQLDWQAARAGLAIDRSLARDHGIRSGHSPYAADARGRQQPVGPDAYALLLRRVTGDDADPLRLERRLEQARVRTLARADALFRGIGMAKGTTGARFSALWRDPRFLFADDDAGQDAAVAAMNAMLAAARARLQRHFPPLPPAATGVRVERMPEAEVRAGRGGYRRLPDADRPGAYIVDLRDIRRRPSWTLRSVVHHELLPGHMIQLPLEARAAPHPLRLEYAGAFVEGWAIYAEQQAAAAGAFRGDPHGELGYCHWMLFRIGRALADIGIHLHGWSVEAARAKLVEWQGEPVYFAPFDSDLARIQAEPASRASEAMTWLALADCARGRHAVAYHRMATFHGRMRTDALRARTAAL